ncbi:MAG: sulfatase [Phycisphaeraceae bacterium]
MHSTRLSLRYFVFALTLLVGFSAEAEQLPNIVFIMADDLGYTDLGVTGSDYYLTPNLDELAGESMVFNAAYANCANCAPTRAALMSGMYAPRTGVYTVGSSSRGKVSDRVLIPTENSDTLDPSFVTIAEVLQDAGYTTAHMGKWHLGVGEAGGPTAHGFDINVAGHHGGHPKSYFSPYRNQFLKDGPKGEYLTDRLTQEAADFIGEQKDSDKPFFLYLPLYTVHTPIQPIKAMAKAADAREKGERHKDPKYAAMVEAMDQYIGRVLDTLDEQGVADNTIVVFTSDNGGHGGFTDQHPLRGSKGMFYEGGIRVPLFVKYPGVTKAGSTFDESVMLLDFFPTFAEVGKGTLPQSQPVDGVSLLPVMRDPSASLGREAIYFHFPAYLQGYSGGEGAEAQRPPWRATPCGVIRSGDWKLIRYFETGNTELFNLANDPGEQNDLSKTEVGKAIELTAKLKIWQKETNAPVPTEKNPKYKAK